MDCLEDDISPEIEELVAQADSKIIPKKSEAAYRKEYGKFMMWVESKKAKIVDESVLLAYMMEMVTLISI
ncbi:MAG TPA: hypothetical protein VEP90_28935 [Methylomirabilota bacterium]|jgi:hypothetical protein|nr:hypothetical protein [Methylomirabilota bacterium]